MIDMKEVMRRNVDLCNKMAAENAKKNIAPVFLRKRTNPEPIFGTKNKVQKTDEFENISSPEVEIIDELHAFIPEKLVKLNSEKVEENLSVTGVTVEPNSDYNSQEKKAIESTDEQRNVESEIVSELDEIQIENPEFTEEQNEEQQNAVNEILAVTLSNENENNPDILKTTIEEIGKHLDRIFRCFTSFFKIHILYLNS
jgi:hypothetical protein